MSEPPHEPMQGERPDERSRGEQPPEPFSDQTTTLATLRDTLRCFNEARDWGQYHAPRNLAMALSVEAAEVLELFLWCRDEGPQPATPQRAEKLEDEVADVLVCLLNLCDRAHIDLARAFERKLAKTAARYPVERVRGDARKYDEYP